MIWQDIVNNSELVYASTIEDKGFRTWSLKKTICNVSFYETYPLEDTERIVCGIIHLNNGIVEQKKIASILGFNVVDNFEVIPKRYADKAELDVFHEIIKSTLNWGLVEQISDVEQNVFFKLTDLGCRAIAMGEKYRFYSGRKVLLENSSIRPSSLKKNLFFPFYSAFGEYSDILEKSQVNYEQIKLIEVFEIEESELVRRHELQSRDHCQIYKSEVTGYFDFASFQADIRLFRNGSEYFPIIFQNNQICIEATELLNSLDNSDLKERKKEWGLYLKLIKDPNASLDFNSLVVFEDLLEFDSLVKDSRLCWSDGKVFNFIADRANANQWFGISNHCPISILKQFLEKYRDKLDWGILSLRIDDDFLMQNATKFPWNFEIISSKENTNIEVIKFLLLIPEIGGQEWDWNRIMPLFDLDFISSNISAIDFELSELTKANVEFVMPLLVNHPSKRWDWLYVSSNYDLNYILDNIINFSNYLHLKNVINRAFISENHVKLFCESSDFFMVLQGAKKSFLRDYQANQADYFWTDQLIDFLECTEYLKWESGAYILGFECNPNTDWNAEFFYKYNSKIKTQKGFNFVSAHISDSRIVIDFSDFNWNWDVISENANLITDIDFLLSVKEKLNYSILLKSISSQTLERIFDSASLLPYLQTNKECWPDVTERITKEFVIRNIDYDWDWSILTRRFCSTFNIEELGNANWVSKWDWSYLTQYLELNLVVAKLDLYIQFWDWEFISRNINKSFIITNLRKYKEWWKWSILVNDRLAKEDFALDNILYEAAYCISFLESEQKLQLWQMITRKFSYSDLVELIPQNFKVGFFFWDFTFFYDMPDFSVLRYIQEYAEYTDWKIISESGKLDKEFKFDSKLTNERVWLNFIVRKLDNPKYKWDFVGLSKLGSINSSFDILKKYKDRFDWNILSLNSKFFRRLDKNSRNIQVFHKLINFQLLSQKIDAGLTERVVFKYLEKDWDWFALTLTISTKTLEFFKEQRDKSWDWHGLSGRQDILFDNDTLLDLANKDWNWDAISSRTDIKFTEEFVIKLFDKPLNWYLISQCKTFVPNAKTLALLKNQNLDWQAISKNTNLSSEIIWDYKNRLDWLCVTRNSIVNISEIEFLKRYQDYVDWNYISKSVKFSVSLESLKLFKDKLNWFEIHSRNDFKITDEILFLFSDVLNWSNISESMDIQFSEELIEKFRKNWDWQLLRKNPQIIDKFEHTLNKYKAEINCVEFIEQFPIQPCIYHFTHLFNAIDIIKDRKILSRTKADGHFSNAAGNIVTRRDTAHQFARFYFRAKTPTQFYNECLGHDSFSGYLKKWTYWDGGTIHCSKWKSYYPQARNLGLPKCPMPVFFKFDLKEVLKKMGDKCYYSTGNMQTKWARVEKVIENPNSINTNHLYSDFTDFENYKQYSQQEFLVIEEFDFSGLDSFEIICFDEEHVKMLKSQLGSNPICEKISSDSSNVFHKGNRLLHVNESETEISISSEYQDSAYLLIKGENLSKIEIRSIDKIQSETVNEIIAYPEFKFAKTDHPFEVYFVDNTLETRNWLVYKN